jgi:hypothetical protein
MTLMTFTALWAVAGELQGVKYGITNPEWVWHVEDLLYQSLRHNPRGPAVRSETLRLIHDIGYYLQRTGEAARLPYGPQVRDGQARRCNYD